jgi:hypothetical protein
MFIPDPDPGPDLDFVPIQDPGSRGQKSTGSRKCNTASNTDSFQENYLGHVFLSPDADSSDVKEKKRSEISISQTLDWVSTFSLILWKRLGSSDSDSEIFI